MNTQPVHDRLTPARRNVLPHATTGTTADSQVDNMTPDALRYIAGWVATNSGRNIGTLAVLLLLRYHRCRQRQQQLVAKRQSWQYPRAIGRMAQRNSLDGN